ncbi:MAG: response regulator, partial [Pseudomonadota bacterium]
EPGQGTTVRLILPRGTETGEREAPLGRTAPVSGRGERILVVEDELSLLMMTEHLITSLGYRLVTARTGAQALERFGDGSEFDLVITDIVMPGGLDGFQLAKALRTRRPDVPLLYTSGYTGYSDDDMGDVIAPLVQKPCPPQELAAAIRRALAKDAADDTG